MAHSEPTEPSFFERERDRLTVEITSSFEELLSSTNRLNRQIEGVLGMTKEYETIATFWDSFHQLMRAQPISVSDADEADGESDRRQQQQRRSTDAPLAEGDEEPVMTGFPGTGGHVVKR